MDTVSLQIPITNTAFSGDHNSLKILLGVLN